MRSASIRSMNASDVSSDEFGRRYGAMNEAELLEEARSYDLLADSAQGALRKEFAERGLEPPVVEEKDELAQRALVTVRRYRDLSEAIVARSLLESAGITVYLRDENLVRLDWQISNFIGGLRLQVEEADREMAVGLLDQPVVDPIPLDGAVDFEQPRSPKCGSNEITFEGSSRGAALASLSMFAVPLPLGRETWSCEVCGTRWEESDSDKEASA